MMDVKTLNEKVTINFNPGTTYDVIIIGAGVAGLSAAMMSCQRGFRTALIEKSVLCGNLYNVPIIEDCPFWGLDMINGHEVATHFSHYMITRDIDTYFEKVLKIDHLDQPVKKIITAQRVLHAKTLILATGCLNKHITIRNSQKYEGKGVSFCVVSDVAFYLQKDVIVYGRGEELIKTALYLSSHVRHVAVVSPESLFQGTALVRRELSQRKNITCYLEHEIDWVLGNDVLDGVRLRSLHHADTFDLKVNALFIYEGITGETGCLNGHNQLTLNGQNQIETNDVMETSINGVYIIGGLRAGSFRRIVTSLADAYLAINRIELYLYFLKETKS